MDKILIDLFEFFDLFNFIELEIEVEWLFGVFFKEVGEYIYIFNYDILYDVVLVYFCVIYLIKIVRYFLFDIIWY